MNPSQLTVSRLFAAGKTWLSLLGPGPASAQTPEAKAAWATLIERNYVPKPAAGKGDAGKPETGKDHHKVGMALFTAFEQTLGQRSGAGVSRKTNKEAADSQSQALVQWLRASHAEVIAVKRGGNDPALAGLPTLGELTISGGLQVSTQQFLAFLADPAVQVALATFNIGAAEIAQGKQLLAAWEAARTSLTTVRGSETTSQRSNIAAREAFAEWLGTWWGIAQVRLADQPGVLEALGVVARPRRRKKAAAAPGTANGNA